MATGHVSRVAQTVLVNDVKLHNGSSLIFSEISETDRAKFNKIRSLGGRQFHLKNHYGTESLKEIENNLKCQYFKSLLQLHAFNGLLCQKGDLHFS